MGELPAVSGQTVYGVRAMFPSFTCLTVLPQIQRVDPVNKFPDLLWIVEQKAGLEIAFVFMLAAQSCAGQVGRADKGHAVVDNNRLGMYPWAEDSFKQLTLNQ